LFSLHFSFFFLSIFIQQWYVRRRTKIGLFPLMKSPHYFFTRSYFQHLHHFVPIFFSNGATPVAYYRISVRKAVKSLHGIKRESGQIIFVYLPHNLAFWIYFPYIAMLITANTSVAIF